MTKGQSDKVSKKQKSKSLKVQYPMVQSFKGLMAQRSKDPDRLSKFGVLWSPNASFMEPKIPYFSSTFNLLYSERLLFQKIEIVQSLNHFFDIFQCVLHWSDIVAIWWKFWQLARADFNPVPKSLQYCTTMENAFLQDDLKFQNPSTKVLHQWLGRFNLVGRDYISFKRLEILSIPYVKFFAHVSPTPTKLSFF